MMVEGEGWVVEDVKKEKEESEQRLFEDLDVNGELTQVKEAQCRNNVKWYSLKSKLLASINWIFGVNKVHWHRQRRPHRSSCLLGFVQIARRIGMVNKG